LRRSILGDGERMRLFRGILPVALLCLSAAGCSFLMKGEEPREDFSYQVEQGDTLSEIGEKFGLTAADLQRYNSIEDPRRLQVGQVLRVPAVGPVEDSRRLFRSESDQQATSDMQLKVINIAHVRDFVGALNEPVEKARLSSQFGWRWNRFHEGADLAARKGTPVYAAHDGEVVLVSESWGRYGKVVVLRGGSLMTVYGHNDRNHVEVGDLVSKGDHIADVGSTGDATGPHLHFETRVQDPQGRFAAVSPHVFYPEN